MKNSNKELIWFSGLSIGTFIFIVIVFPSLLKWFVAEYPLIVAVFWYFCYKKPSCQ
jgi:hypothetical protein